MKCVVIVTKLNDTDGYVLTGYKHNQDTDKLEIYDLDGLGESYKDLEPIITIGREENSDAIDGWFGEELWDCEDVSFAVPWNNEERFPDAHEIQERNIVFFL